MEIIIISPRATLCFCFGLIRFDYTNKVHVGSCKLTTVKPVLDMIGGHHVLSGP